MTAHWPVLLEEVLDGLAASPSGAYVDATYGRGGHSEAIVEHLGPAGRLVVMDRDLQAVEAARGRWADDPRVMVRHRSFAGLEPMWNDLAVAQKANGILLDLGVSSPQLDDPERGFSFSKDGPLDMRMDASTGITAADWLAKASEREIQQVIKRYGEDPNAKRIARAIVSARNTHALTRTRQLADCVSATLGRRPGKLHPATRAFQAIRIFINDELGQLRSGLQQALNILAPQGRLCVISFHSLEDRIVKRFLRDRSRPDPVFAGLPEIPAHARPALRLVGKAVRPSALEVSNNPRARSAVLRVAERLPQ